MLGKIVKVTIDRPLGSFHPTHKDLYYPVNYGFVEGILGGDGEYQDAYVLGTTEPLTEFTGKVIAIIHRLNDVEDKWVVAPPEKAFTQEQIYKQVEFQEKYFKIEIQTWSANMTDLSKLKLVDLQPSQLYISEEKLLKIKQWFTPNDVSNIKPIPIKIIDGRYVIMDGHTRCVCAILAGLDSIPLELEKDQLNWDMYKACINECLLQNITSPYDLVKRFVSKEEYKVKWHDWCDEMQKKIIQGK